MQVLLFAIFLTLALAAIGFAVWPLLRQKRGRGVALLVAAVAALVLGLSFGSYMLLGSPALASRSLTGPSNNDIRGLVAALAQRVLQRPQDAHGWILLGRGYLTLDDPADAAAAFKRALLVAQPSQRAELLSAYAEALALASNGAVSPEAESAFTDALKSDPHNRAALFYLGQLAAQRGDNTRALTLWETLLMEVPSQSPLHDMLLNRVAALRAQTGPAPDINAMVEGLAARLKSNPDDPPGWVRLVRAYSVLGKKKDARQALADARAALKNDRSGLAALDAEATNDRL